jgi:hypothetical protein
MTDCPCCERISSADVGDPRGGVRWMLPERASSWERGDG